MSRPDSAPPGDPRARREWVKYQLRLRGTSLAQIGRELGVTRWAVHRVFRVPYPRIERAIAERLQCRPPDIWPERFDADGRRLRCKPGPKPGSQARIPVPKGTSGKDISGKAPGHARRHRGCPPPGSR